MTLEQINALTLEDCWTILLERLIDASEYNNTIWYYLDSDINLNFYDRISLSEGLVKPDLEILNVELDIYKSELIAIEEARLVEIERKKNLSNRWENLKNRDAGVPAFSKIIPNISNHDKYIIDLINDSSRATEIESIMTSIENEELNIINELKDNEYKDERKKLYWDVGDQLDAIFKMAVTLRDSGINLGEEGDAWVDHIIVVKDSVPKP